LIEKGAKVDLTEKKNKRSIDQNSYLHVCVGFVAKESGYTMEEAKTTLKREFGSFLVYEKRGRKFLRSTSDLDAKECTQFIDFIRNLAMNQFGCYIPTSEEYLTNSFDIDKLLDQVR
jgi:hypothetical protein